jgi:hypothetical protein
MYLRDFLHSWEPFLLVLIAASLSLCRAFLVQLCCLDTLRKRVGVNVSLKHQLEQSTILWYYHPCSVATARTGRNSDSQGC